MTVGNRHGLLVPSGTTDQELQQIRNSLPDRWLSSGLELSCLLCWIALKIHIWLKIYPQRKDPASRRAVICFGECDRLQWLCCACSPRPWQVSIFFSLVSWSKIHNRQPWSFQGNWGDTGRCAESGGVPSNSRWQCSGKKKTHQFWLFKIIFSKVGSYCALSNNGGLLSPKTSVTDLEELSSLLQVWFILS